jgi:hypothetical protein
MVNMSQIEILGGDGKPVLYAALQDGEFRLEFEYYGHSSGQNYSVLFGEIPTGEFKAIDSVLCARAFLRGDIKEFLSRNVER